MTVRAENLEPGRYVCVRTRGPLAAIIRRACRSPYNHVFITGPGGRIAEAKLTGCRISRLTAYTGCQACANAHEPMTAAQGGQVWAAATAMTGDPYNYLDLACIGIGDLGWHWKWLIRLCGAGPWRMCSQLAVLAGRAADPPMNWEAGAPDPDQVTPADLARRPGVIPVTIGSPAGDTSRAGRWQRDRGGRRASGLQEHP